MATLFLIQARNLGDNLYTSYSHLISRSISKCYFYLQATFIFQPLLPPPWLSLLFQLHPLSPGLICSTTSFPIFTLVPHYVYSKHGSQSGPVKNRNQIPFLCSNSPMTSHSKIKSLKWPITSCFPPHLMLLSPHCSLNTQVFFYLRTYVFIVPSVWNDYIQISSWLILQHSFYLYPITLSVKPPWTSHPKLQPTPP